MRVGWCLAMLLLAACTVPLPAPTLPEAPTQPGPEFSSENAWRHLEALAEIGPRVTGTPGADAALQYILSQLEVLGLNGREEELAERLLVNPGSQPPRNIKAMIPGDSKDLIVLAAPYDSRSFDSFEFLGVNDGASGAAMVLELARVLKGRSLPYTTMLLFLDAESRTDEDASAFDEPRLVGSQVQAFKFSRDGIVPNIRLLVVLNRVCDPDLVIARDLISHRLYREQFWDAAAKLDHGKAFPDEAGFEVLLGSHIPFAQHGVRRVVYLSDSNHGGGEAPGAFSNSEDDNLEHCDSGSLQVVGDVTLAALDAIAERLRKIDRVADSPFDASPEATSDDEITQAPDSSAGSVEEAGAEPTGSTLDAAVREMLDPGDPVEAPADPGPSEAPNRDAP